MLRTTINFLIFIYFFDPHPVQPLLPPFIIPTYLSMPIILPLGMSFCMFYQKAVRIPDMFLISVYTTQLVSTIFPLLSFLFFATKILNLQFLFCLKPIFLASMSLFLSLGLLRIFYTKILMLFKIFCNHDPNCCSINMNMCGELCRLLIPEVLTLFSESFFSYIQYSQLSLKYTIPDSWSFQKFIFPMNTNLDRSFPKLEDKKLIFL